MNKKKSNSEVNLLVIIVTFNGMKWLEKCLSSVTSSSIHSDLFIVDNGSTDGTIDFIKNAYHEAYDIPGGEARGAHAHKECHQFLIAASGSYEVLLDDGINKRTVLLNRPFYGLHIPPGIWAAEQGFSSGSICLVLASEGYDEADYIRDYNEYKEYLQMLTKANVGEAI